jgi:hypothetical protein
VTERDLDVSDMAEDKMSEHLEIQNQAGGGGGGSGGISVGTVTRLQETFFFSNVLRDINLWTSNITRMEILNWIIYPSL